MGVNSGFKGLKEVAEGTMGNRDIGTGNRISKVLVLLLGDIKFELS